MALSQEQFAEMLDITSQYLSEIERGLKMPSMKIFIKFVNVAEVSADFLLRNEISAGKPYVLSELNELTKKMDDLTPAQLRLVRNVLAAMLESFEDKEC